MPLSNLRAFAFSVLVCIVHAHLAMAQNPPTPDSLAVVTVRVQRDSTTELTLLESAVVRSGTINLRTTARGEVTLRLPRGTHTIVAAKVGYRPDSTTVALNTLADTTVLLRLMQQAAAVNTFVVTSTRGERRVEDTPIRVEVIDEEEMAEKVAMSPGDIGMMLNETSGLRVQSTNPSLGGANVRVQGLRGRYSLILADGLPLYGGQAGGLGLLQIPPVDLGRVEIIKGTASALYGSSALGGVIDLISRRPGEKAERTVLANQTSRNGTDVVFFFNGPITEHIGATLLASGNRQQRTDSDDDGWTDIPGYTRGVVRPRIYFDNQNGLSAFLTGGFTAEQRDGGTFTGRVTPAGIGYTESLGTRRGDLGALARWVIPNEGALHGSILTVRSSGVEQRHAHQFGTIDENDQHRTWFGEASLAVPRGAVTYLAGAAFQQESYHAENVPGFDYAYNIPSAFAQLDVDARTWLSLSGSLRADAHSTYGTFVNPRVSVLLRPSPGKFLTGWTARVSVGTGAFAPTPFVEETEVTGLAPLRPLSGLVAERAASGSIDIGGPVQTRAGELQINATVFASRVRHPLQVAGLAIATPTGASEITLLNGVAPTQTWGSELLARLSHPLGADDEARVFRVTGTYTFMRSTECAAVDPAQLLTRTYACERDEVALTPRHAAGLVATIESEGTSRVGLELYYTGQQRLENNPYRSASRPYLIAGLMGERAFKTRSGTARLFLNLENMTNVRQTNYDPLLLPARGMGGRWTTDAWTDLNGFTANGGIRFMW